MTPLSTPDITMFDFTDTQLFTHLSQASDAALDALAFGVIGFNETGAITRYNRFEAEVTGLNQARQIGKDLFTEVAQCMNNYLVAQRFDDALDNHESLDATLDYVLTWRMKPSQVQLRLLAEPTSTTRYIALTPRTYRDHRP